ncbi:hypothetical protein NQZ68_034281 [Dissostichus eleginoides]|nr:hypothetical protein NQZ68_034281 [Dissostichus eleginoides]
MGKPGPLLVPLVAALAGSGRQQVACDEKFSAEPDSGDVGRRRRRRRVVGGRGRGRKLTPPHGLIRTPTPSPVCPFDCQNTVVPDLDESESWRNVNMHHVCECREGTERL